MAFLQRGVLLAATAGAIAFPTVFSRPEGSASAPPTRTVVREVVGSPVRQGDLKPAAPTDPQSKYSPNAIEHYLSTEQMYYIRPGLKITLVSFTNVAAGQKPVAEVKITDDFDQPLDREGKVTPGPVSASFVLARWDADRREYFSYTTRTRNGVTNPSADQGGTWTAIELGRYKYTFGTTLPANLDPTRTLTLGMYGRRTLADIVGKDYYATNTFKDFRPDGAAPSQVWAAMDEATSCNNCHDPIDAHGGTRRDTKMCAMCHTSQASLTTEGQTVDFKVMIHKIHFGPNLPSVKGGKPYVVAGADFSHTTLPLDIRNCVNCHYGSGAKPVEADIFNTRPSSKACGACHDDVNFTTGVNHPAGPATDDTCASCHVPQGEAEFDASIKGAHTIPAKSKQLKGLKAEILSVDQVGAGKKPVVTFKLTNGDGSIVDGTKLNSFAPILAGPTSDYKQYFRETGAQARVVFNGTTSVYTFTNAIPADASGTWVISADIYRNATLKRADGGADITFREAAFNPIKYIVVSGKEEPRRKNVNITSCDTCHDHLKLHGEQRQSTEECVICHNPVTGDESRRPAAGGKPESIDMRRMVHRIHTGEELTQEYSVYGFSGTPIGFNEVLYPGDRRNCTKCHISGTQNLPPKAELNVKTERDYFTPQGPGTAACLGCHDSRDAAAHAYLNTAPFGEACATCHGPGADWAVDKVHAR